MHVVSLHAAARLVVISSASVLFLVVISSAFLVHVIISSTPMYVHQFCPMWLYRFDLFPLSVSVMPGLDVGGSFIQ